MLTKILPVTLAGMLWGQDLYQLPVPETDTATSDTATVDTAAAEDTVHWSSEGFRYQADQDRFSLYQKAVLQYKGASLQADTIYLHNEEQRVEALGSPVIQEGNQPEIMGYRLKYNHKRQVGEIYYGYTKRDGHTFTGMEVRRQKTGEVYIARGCLAPCDDLSFYFYSRRMVLEPNEKVIARPIVMNISDVPVAVAPMFVVPLGRGRRSGFLRPKLGGDQSQGFYMRDLGYYWALNDYTDFKLAGDLVEGEQGTFDETNIAGVYTYNKRNTLSGNLGGKAYVKEFDPSNSGWEVNFAHDQNITPDGVQKLTGSGRFVSDTRVLSEALDEEEATDQTANAQLGYANTLKWNQTRVNVTGTQLYNLTTGKLSREFPKASLAFSAPLFPQETSEYWDATDEVSRETWYQKLNYSYRGDANLLLDRKPGSEGIFGDSVVGDTNTYLGARNNLTLDAKYTVMQFINVTPSLQGAHYWNLHTKGPDGKPVFDDDIGSGRFGDNLLKFNTGVSTNTKLFGIAEPNLGRWEKIRHVITPTVGFNYAPEIDTNRYFLAHPRLSTSAFQQEQRTVNLGLANDVDVKILPRDTGQEAVSYKVLSLNSSVSHNFKAPIRKWSDINSTFRTEIVKNIPLTVNFTHRLYDDYDPGGNVNQVVPPILTRYNFDWRKSISLAGKMYSGGVDWDPENPKSQSPWSGNVSYGFRYDAQRVSRIAFQRRLNHSFSGQLKLHPTPKWEMTYNTNYDFEAGEFSKHSFSFHRTLRCWKMDFTWTPVGISQGWQFKIYVIDLPDIKLESAQTDLQRF